MKKGFSILFIFIQLSIFAIVFWLSGCAEEVILNEESKVNIEGFITETKGTPAFGMQVNIVNGTGDFPKSSAETDQSGYYNIPNVTQGTFEIAVSDKKGNRLAIKSINITKGLTYKLNFVVPDQDNEEFIIGDMQVQDVLIQLLESYPLQVHLVVNGYLNDGCTTINEITQRREGNIIHVHITTKRPKDAMCTQAIRFVTENIPLEGGFIEGSYKVIVNGFEKEFKI